MPDSISKLFFLDRNSAEPMYVQICESIRTRIIDGRIKQGAQLPPSRIYADDLGVSRTTVVSAYDQLLAEGYVEGRQGSGLFVCGIAERQSSDKHINSLPVRTQSVSDSSAPRLPQPGAPDMRLFPYKKWSQCVSRIARTSPQALIEYRDSFGDRELRVTIAQYLAEWRGLTVSADQIIITAGSIDALELCIRALLRPGERVGLENPGYLPLRNIATSQGMTPMYLPIDSSGACVPNSPDSNSNPKLVIITPSHQFPLGGTMSPARRAEYINWAEKTDSWIIEDDYDSEFRYSGRPIPAMTGFDQSWRMLYVGTFSKVFTIGLRLGYVIVPPNLIDKFSGTLASFGIKASVASQRALAEFIETGEFARHIRRVRRVYGQRRKFLIKAVQERFTELSVRDEVQAGMHIVADLPAQFEDQRLAMGIKQRGGAANPLSAYYSTPTKRRGLLLGFCAFTETEIVDNLNLIGQEFDTGRSIWAKP